MLLLSPSHLQGWMSMKKQQSFCLFKGVLVPVLPLELAFKLAVIHILQVKESRIRSLNFNNTEKDLNS